MGQFPIGLHTAYYGEYGNNIITPRVYSRIAAHGAAPDGNGGFGVLEDFRTFGGILDSDISATAGFYASESGWFRSYQDTSDTIAQVATEKSGVIRFTTAATDNNESWLSPGGAATVNGVISTTAGEPTMYGFGYRVRFTQVTDTYNAFLGAGEEGLAAADTITDAAALKTTADFIGFHVAEGDGDALTFKYQKASAAVQTVLTYSTALAAATWYNLEFLYDSSQPDSKKGTIWINGVEQTSYITAANLAASTFPNGEELNLLMGIKNQTNASKSIDLDGFWLYCGR